MESLLSWACYTICNNYMYIIMYYVSLSSLHVSHFSSNLLCLYSNAMPIFDYNNVHRFCLFEINDNDANQHIYVLCSYRRRLYERKCKYFANTMKIALVFTLHIFLMQLVLSMCSWYFSVN